MRFVQLYFRNDDTAFPVLCFILGSNASQNVSAIVSADSLLLFFYFFDEVFPCLNITENVISICILVKPYCIKH